MCGLLGFLMVVFCCCGVFFGFWLVFFVLLLVFVLFKDDLWTNYIELLIKTKF